MIKAGYSVEMAHSLATVPIALQWFLKAAEADSDGVTDAEDRIGELA